MFRSSGVTSRGRVGLTSSTLGAGALVNPWFQDPVDKSTLIQGINEVISAAKNGQNFFFFILVLVTNLQWEQYLT